MTTMASLLARAIIKVPVSALPQPHRDIFDQAMRNVLSTKAAQTAYAQIIDGCPLTSVAADTRGSGALYEKHPLFEIHHEKLCPGAWEKMQEFYTSFSIDVFSMDETVCLWPDQPCPNNLMRFNFARLHSSTPTA